MLEYRLDGAVARLTLARPEARNAVPRAGWDEIARQAQRAVDEGATVLVLCARGTAFCAGADLGEFAGLRDDPALRALFRQAMRRGIDALAALPIPVVAAVDGDCYGAGVALAIACDIRVAGPAARFAITPAKLGISYPQEDVARLVSLVGPGQASRLLLGAAPIDASEALRIGLVEHLDEDADAIAAAIAANDPASIAALKAAVRLAAAGVAGDRAQDDAFDALFASPGFAARLARIRR